MRVSNNAEFTKEMRKTHTIYMPDMIHYHNDLLRAAFGYGGYKLDIVPEYSQLSRSTFSTIGKDYCTCATFIVGNLLTFLENGDCDPGQVAFLEPQAGGACRAGNYYNLIIECLRKTGYGFVPVLSLNAHGEESHSGFKINAKMLFGAVAAVCYSDLLMTLTQQIKAYEINKGEAETLRKEWIGRLYKHIYEGKNLFNRKNIYHAIVEDFKNIPVDKSKDKKKVGIVGELYIKFSPIGNEHLEEFLSEKDCDYRMGGFLNYCIYVVYTEMQSMKLLGKSSVILAGYQKVINFMCKMQDEINDALEKHNFLHDGRFYDMYNLAKKVISEYYNIGDGWLMTAEIIDLINQGYEKILVVHPFGCLVSHVGGRGVLKKLHKMYPGVNINSIEFDYEQSDVLRENRIILALS